MNDVWVAIIAVVCLVLLRAKIQYHSTVKYTQVYINSPVNTHTLL